MRDITFGAAPTAGGGAGTIYKLQGAGAPVDGVTGVGIVAKGEKYLDTTNVVEYINVGTIAAPVWHGHSQTVP